MEATTTGEGLSKILNGVSILPPRPEDAGLEDCALPPDSIMEAFSRAAAAKFLAASSDEDDGDECVQDPGPSNGPTHDALVIGGEEEEQRVGGKRSCIADGGEGLGEEKKKGQHKLEDNFDYDEGSII